MVVPTHPPGPQAEVLNDLLKGLARLLSWPGAGRLLVVAEARPAALGPVVRHLLPTHPELRVCGHVQELLQLPADQVAILPVSADEGPYLNIHRATLASRRLRVVAWLEPGALDALRRAAPDFLDWASHVLWCPEVTPQFAHRTVWGALRDRRAFGLTWAGDAFPPQLLPDRSRPGPRLSPSLRWSEILGRLDTPGVPVWTEVSHPLRWLRCAWAMAEGRGGGPCILERPTIRAEGTWQGHAQPAALSTSVDRLAASGHPRPGLLAALLDLEPEAIELALSQRDIDLQALLEAADPGAWLARQAYGPGTEIADAVYRRAAPAPVLRAYATAQLPQRRARWRPDACPFGLASLQALHARRDHLPAGREPDQAWGWRILPGLRRRVSSTAWARRAEVALDLDQADVALHWLGRTKEQGAIEPLQLEALALAQRHEDVANLLQRLPDPGDERLALRRALLRYDLGDPRGAEAAFEGASPCELSLGEQVQRAWLRSQIAWEAGDRDGARRAYEEAIRIASTGDLRWHRAIRALLQAAYAAQIGLHEEATSLVTTAEPLLEETFGWRGGVLWQSAQWTRAALLEASNQLDAAAEALKELERSAVLTVTSPSPRWSAQAALIAQRPEEALQHTEVALRRLRGSWGALSPRITHHMLTLRGYLLLAVGQAVEAHPVFEEAIAEVGPTDASSYVAWFGMASSLLAMNRRPEMEAPLAETLRRLTPQVSAETRPALIQATEVYVLALGAATAVGPLRDTLNALRERGLLGPDAIGLTLALAQRWVALGSYPEAIAAFREALSLGPSPQEALTARWGLAHALHAAGAHREAIDELQACPTPSVRDTYALQRTLGDWLRAEGRPIDAALAYERAREAAHEDGQLDAEVEVLADAGLAWLAASNIDRAAELLAEAWRRSEGSWSWTRRADLARGLAYATRGDRGRATTALEELLTAASTGGDDPRLRVEVLLELGSLYRQDAAWERAIDVVEEAWRRAQGLDDALTHRAELALGITLAAAPEDPAGRGSDPRPRALHHLNHALQRPGPASEERDRAELERVRLQISLGAFEQAEQHAKEAAGQVDEDGSPWSALSDPIRRRPTTPLARLAHQLATAGRWAEAEAMLRPLLARPMEPWDRVIMGAMLAACLRHLGAPDPAAEELARSRSLIGEAQPQGWRWAVALLDLAREELASGARDLAQAHALQALGALRQEPASTAPELHVQAVLALVETLDDDAAQLAVLDTELEQLSPSQSFSAALLLGARRSILEQLDKPELATAAADQQLWHLEACLSAGGRRALDPLAALLSAEAARRGDPALLHRSVAAHERAYAATPDEAHADALAEVLGELASSGRPADPRTLEETAQALRRLPQTEIVRLHLGSTLLDLALLAKGQERVKLLQEAGSATRSPSDELRVVYTAVCRVLADTLSGEGRHEEAAAALKEREAALAGLDDASRPQAARFEAFIFVQLGDPEHQLQALESQPVAADDHARITSTALRLAGILTEIADTCASGTGTRALLDHSLRTLVSDFPPDMAIARALLSHLLEQSDVPSLVARAAKIGVSVLPTHHPSPRVARHVATALRSAALNAALSSFDPSLPSRVADGLDRALWSERANAAPPWRPQDLDLAQVLAVAGVTNTPPATLAEIARAWPGTDLTGWPEDRSASAALTAADIRREALVSQLLEEGCTGGAALAITAARIGESVQAVWTGLRRFADAFPAMAAPLEPALSVQELPPDAAQLHPDLPWLLSRDLDGRPPWRVDLDGADIVIFARRTEQRPSAVLAQVSALRPLGLTFPVLDARALDDEAATRGLSLFTLARTWRRERAMATLAGPPAVTVLRFAAEQQRSVSDVVHQLQLLGLGHSLAPEAARAIKDPASALLILSQGGDGRAPWWTDELPYQAKPPHFGPADEARWGRDVLTIASFAGLRVTGAPASSTPERRP
jgi:hypothetical protein